MGWFDDLVKDPVGTISNTVNDAGSSISNTVNRELSNAGNSINQIIDDADRGDVGKFVVEQGQSAVNITKAPFEIAYYGFRGDKEGVSRAAQRAVGASINRRGSESGNIFNQETVSNRLAQTDVGQYVLRNPNISNATGGISEDYAGFIRGARTLQDNAYLSREDQNSAIRFGVKGAAFAATAAYGKPLYKTLVSKEGLGAAGGSGIVSSLLKGDVKEAVKQISEKIGIPDISDYIPDTTPDVPSYINNPKAPAGSGGTKVTDPWDTRGSDYGVVNAAQASMVPLVLGVSVLAFFYFRGRK